MLTNTNKEKWPAVREFKIDLTGLAHNNESNLARARSIPTAEAVTA